MAMTMATPSRWPPARARRGGDHDDVLGLTHAEAPEALIEEPPEIVGVVARAVVEEKERASAGSPSQRGSRRLFRCFFQA